MKDATLIKYMRSLLPAQRGAVIQYIRAMIIANNETARIGKIKKLRQIDPLWVDEMLGEAPWYRARGYSDYRSVRRPRLGR